LQREFYVPRLPVMRKMEGVVLVSHVTVVELWERSIVLSQFGYCKLLLRVFFHDANPEPQL